MSSELLVSIVAFLLSLALAYIPGVKEWFESLDGPGKARVVAVGLIAVSVGVFALACANVLVLFGLQIACTAASAVELLKILVAALVANQSTYTLLVRPFKK